MVKLINQAIPTHTLSNEQLATILAIAREVSHSLPEDAKPSTTDLPKGIKINKQHKGLQEAGINHSVFVIGNRVILHKKNQNLGSGSFGTVNVGTDLNAINKSLAVKAMTTPDTKETRRDIFEEMKINQIVYEDNFYATCTYIKEDKAKKKEPKLSLLERRKQKKAMHMLNEMRVSDKPDVKTKTIMLMELAKGTSLDNLPNPSLEELSAIILETFKEVEAMHKKGVLHCDLKADNIIWDKETGKLRLIDFGCALRCEDKNNLNKSVDIIKGNPKNFAPEVTNTQDGSYLYSDKTDTFAVAKMFNDMLDKEYLMKHNTSAYQHIKNLITKAMAEDPSARITTNDVVNGLSAVPSHLSLETPSKRQKEAPKENIQNGNDENVAPNETRYPLKRRL